jgi:ABC-type nickel/cobalt efflux system permease component RcnA
MQSEKILPKNCAGVALCYVLLTLAALAIVLCPTMAFAHPMGNFSISHYSGITIERDSLDVLYLIDMAEIPTFQEMQENGLNGHPDDSTLQSYLTAKSVEFASGLSITVGGQRVALQPISRNVIFTPGAGGLPTMKFGFLYRAKAACKLDGCRLSFQDVNFPGRAGWKEVVVKAGRDIVLMNSTVPDHDRSGQLTNYPTDLVNSAPQTVEASITFAPAAPAATSKSSVAAVERVPLTVRSSKQHVTAEVAATQSDVPEVAASSAKQPGIDITPNRQQTPRSAFTELIASQRMGIGITLLAALIAAGLGALHALEPGHGKTIVAAYLVGSKGTAWHAFLLGLIVTITHTAGVYLLGAVTLYAQKYILPERLYPFLGVLSGILIAGMGFYLFLQRCVGGELGHSHIHGAGGHSDGSLFRLRATNGDPATVTDSTASVSRRFVPTRQLLVLGITGGIVPCPAALVVLLSAVALHRVLFGLFLILSFSVGLAVVLIAMGMVAVYAGRLMSRVGTDGPLIQRWLPLVSALMITVLGSVITVHGLMAAGIVQIRV